MVFFEEEKKLTGDTFQKGEWKSELGVRIMDCNLSNTDFN